MYTKNIDDNLLRKLYSDKNIAYDDMAKILGCSSSTVKRRAKVLNIAFNRRIWTDDEIEYVDNNIGIHSLDEIGEKLGKSREAVKQYRCRHKLSTSYQNFYSYTLLEKELGRSRGALRKYYNRGWIKGKKASWTSSFGKCPMIFLEKDIVYFLKEHYILFDYKKIPNLYFKNIVRNEYERNNILS